MAEDKEKQSDDCTQMPDAAEFPSAAQTPCGSSDGPRYKLESYNWLEDIPGGFADSEYVEVTFKNTRKGYYRNSTHIPLQIGDMVAVEAIPGHDIGRVSLVGLLVEHRMRRGKNGEKKTTKTVEDPVKRVFRKARPGDLERYEEARARENETMIKARRIAAELGLNMKIGDVEYQGDGNKAIFYYIADERVDFRKLIKVLADTFKVRIEMKQIGARQEAGRIGGIGPCGRPLCCSRWMTNFVSVATSAARYQDISLNPQKLAGQCAKLKCCLNFEVDTYVESSKYMPGKEIRLETADATYFYFKADIFKREITYSTDKNFAANLVTITAARAFEVIKLNRAGEKPLTLAPDESDKPKEKKAFGDILGQDDLTRFDKKKKKRKKTQKTDRPKPGQHESATSSSAVPADAPARPESEPSKRRNKRKPNKPKKQDNSENKGAPKPPEE